MPDGSITAGFWLLFWVASRGCCSKGTAGVVLGLFYSRTQRIKCFGSTGVMVEVPFGTMRVKREEHCGCGSSNRNDVGRGRGRGRGSGKGQDGERFQQKKTTLDVSSPFFLSGDQRKKIQGCLVVSCGFTHLVYNR
ncbi:hypothetical protein R6Q57_019130 [Mikania cordata]